MYNYNEMYSCPYWSNTPMHRADNTNDVCDTYSCPYYFNPPMYSSELWRQSSKEDIPFADGRDYDLEFDFSPALNDNGFIELRDYGPNPFVINIEEAAKQNNTFRTALWTGRHLQLTLMSIGVHEDIGLEIHPNLDQFIRIEEGQGIVRMGKSRNNLDFERRVSDDFAFIIPAGTWHNLINTGNTPIKLYSIYAPPQHPHGTVHETKKDAMAAEGSHH